MCAGWETTTQEVWQADSTTTRGMCVSAAAITSSTARLAAAVRKAVEVAAEQRTGGDETDAAGPGDGVRERLEQRSSERLVGHRRREVESGGDDLLAGGREPDPAVAERVINQEQFARGGLAEHRRG